MFTLDPAQHAEVYSAYIEALGKSQTVSGVWRPVYEKLYEFITLVEYEVDPNGGGTAEIELPALGVDHNVWLWVRGARLVNDDAGPFAELIREFTKISTKSGMVANCLTPQ